jgi:hypothetical protein
MYAFAIIIQHPLFVGWILSEKYQFCKLGKSLVKFFRKVPSYPESLLNVETSQTSLWWPTTLVWIYWTLRVLIIPCKALTIQLSCTEGYSPKLRLCLYLLSLLYPQKRSLGGVYRSHTVVGRAVGRSVQTSVAFSLSGA